MARISRKPISNAQYCVMKAPFGCLGIETQMVEGSLMISKIDYLSPNALLINPQNQLAKEAIDQLNAYFQNPPRNAYKPKSNVSLATKGLVLWGGFNPNKWGAQRSKPHILAFLGVCPR